MDEQNEWKVQGKRKVGNFLKIVLLSAIKRPVQVIIIELKYSLIFVIVTCCVYLNIASSEWPFCVISKPKNSVFRRFLALSYEQGKQTSNYGFNDFFVANYTSGMTWFRFATERQVEAQLVTAV